jgi:hypothetical protein
LISITVYLSQSVRMLSTFGVLPASARALSGVPLPVVVTVQPLAPGAAALPAGAPRPPRCNRCGAYLSADCLRSAREWRCALCYALLALPPGAPAAPGACELAEAPELLPVRHCLVVLAAVERAAVRACLGALPPGAPVRVVTSPDAAANAPEGTAAQLLAELDGVAFPAAAVPFAAAARAVVALLGGALAGPCWCRVFIETPPAGAPAASPLLDFVRRQRAARVRIDFAFVGAAESPLLAALIRSAPGVARVFDPIDAGDVAAALLPDARREFAFQVQVRLRAGVAYAPRFLPSAFLPASEADGVVTVPVLPSDTAALSFELAPPDADEGLRYQGLQCVVRFARWNPRTNRVGAFIRIISQDFRVSASTPALIDSVSPVLLFHAWVRAAQDLPMPQIPFVIPQRLKALAPILLEHPSLRPIVRMAFLVKSHPALSPSFQQRLTMGSLLSLSPPLAVGAQFSYQVEAWSDQRTLVESGLRVAENRRRGNYIFVIKSFPNVFVASRPGRIVIEKDAPLSESIEAFIAACRPLPVRIVQAKVSAVAELLSVDEEEGLSEFLQEAGLESLLSDIV